MPNFGARVILSDIFMWSRPKVVRALLACGISGGNIGVIAFYRAQMRLIERNIAQFAAARMNDRAEDGEGHREADKWNDSVMVRHCA